jgi:ubiquinone/menaquinone biosynthesis C-methylase UbiE
MPGDNAAVEKAMSGDKPLMINAGSGQRPFDQAHGWINVDIQERWNPDVVADWRSMPMFEDGSAEIIVAHHILEHCGCGEANEGIKECWRILEPGGSFLVLVPDLRKLAQRWLTRQLDTQLYLTQLYGAYMGDDADRHAWGFDAQHLGSTLERAAGCFAIFLEQFVAIHLA